MANNIFKVCTAVFIICGLSNVGYTQIPERLNSKIADSTGYLKIDILDQDSIYVVINNNFENILKIESGDTLSFKPGVINLRIIKQYYLDLVRNMKAEEGTLKSFQFRLIPIRSNTQMSRRSSYPRIFWQANHFIQSDPDTDLYIDGQFAGTQYATVDTSGSFEVKGIHESGKEFIQMLRTEGVSSFNYHELYMKPDRRKAFTLSFLPGGSQLYKRQKIKGILFSTVIAGGLTATYFYEQRFQTQKQSFNDANSRYFRASTHQEAFRLGFEAEQEYDEMLRFSKIRNRVLLGTAAVYLANIVDGFIAPSIGYRDESRKIDPYLDFDSMYRQPVIGIKSSF